MQIKYSKHIETRLALRKIEYNLPKRIYEAAGERFTDTETGHTIAVMRAPKNRDRNFLIFPLLRLRRRREG